MGSKQNRQKQSKYLEYKALEIQFEKRKREKMLTGTLTDNIKEVNMYDPRADPRST